MIILRFAAAAMVTSPAVGLRHADTHGVAKSWWILDLQEAARAEGELKVTCRVAGGRTSAPCTSKSLIQQEILTD
jgi:hypothetical protein